MTNTEEAAGEYRKLLKLPLGWEPDYSDMKWNWFKIGWDAQWVSQQLAGSQPSEGKPMTDEELEDLSQAHVAYTNSRGQVECAAMSDDACAYSDARAWPCRTRRLIDAYRALTPSAGSQPSAEEKP